MLHSAISLLFEGNNFIRLIQGILVTVRIAMLSISLSIFFGIFVGILMQSKNIVIKVITKVYLETVRIMPQLVLLMLVYFGLSKTFQIQISGEMSAILVFTFWGTAEMADLIRSSLQSISKHHYESGMALGFNKRQVLHYIILPLIFRQMLPLTINLITRMIKTTSLTVLIGVVEVTKAGQQIIDANRYTFPDAALWIYGFVFVLYFIICYPMSLLSKKLEKMGSIR
jgi:polar amino acid transport system permease protein